jgi:hypothetical protein
MLEFEMAANNYRPLSCPACRAGVFENMKYCPLCGAAVPGAKPLQSHLRFALDRMLARLKPFDQEIRDATEDINNDHWHQLEGGILDQDKEGRFHITNAKLKERVTKQRELLAKTTIKVEPYFAASMPKDIDYSFLEAFRGIVILDSEVDRIMNERERAMLSARENGDDLALRQSDDEAPITAGEVALDIAKLSGKDESSELSQ